LILNSSQAGARVPFVLPFVRRAGLIHHGGGTVAVLT
jgi:hypothetical protein